VSAGVCTLQVSVAGVTCVSAGVYTACECRGCDVGVCRYVYTTGECSRCDVCARCRTDSPLYEFLESCLRHKSEMVIYEAAHAIVNMKQTSAKELAPAVSVLQLFCGSSKPTLRFAAVRTLNKVDDDFTAALLV